MTREVVSVGTDIDQEEVARAIQRYDFLAVPVVDRERRLVGIVTVDDVIDVIEQEATRDLYAAGAVQAGDEDDYFQSNLFTVARRRVVWLLVLLVANSGTSAVIASQELVLKQVVVLAAFIPLLIGTGGNVGAQSSTVVIRGLSTQRIQAMGAWRAIWRESVAGALLGNQMGRGDGRKAMTVIGAVGGGVAGHVRAASVRPISSGGMPSRSAIVEAPRTSKSPPTTNRGRPPANKR